MNFKVLTVTIGPLESDSNTYYANTRDEETNTWLGVAYDSSPRAAFTRLLKLIVEDVDNPMAHWWQF